MTSDAFLMDELKKIPVDWREDFVVLIEGGNPSPEFEQYFDLSRRCQEVFERVLRYLDRDLIKLLKEAVR
jgi:hypothetical protein